MGSETVEGQGVAHQIGRLPSFLVHQPVSAGGLLKNSPSTLLAMQHRATGGFHRDDVGPEAQIIVDRARDQRSPIGRCSNPPDHAGVPVQIRSQAHALFVEDSDGPGRAGSGQNARLHPFHIPLG